MVRGGRRAAIRWGGFALAAILASLSHPAMGSGPDDTNVTVITAQEMEREKPADLAALLRSKVGLDDSGGTITMRGVRGVAIYVDGFASSLTDLNQIKPDQVERIDILRGAASARFGADAMGGAIAVATRKAGDKPRFELVQGLNSAGSWYTRLSGAGLASPASIGMTGERQIVHGHKRVPFAPYASQISVENERTEKTALEAKIGLKNETGEAQLQIKRLDSLSSYGRPNWWEDYGADTLRLTSVFKASPTTELNLSLGYEAYTDKGLKDRGTGTDVAGLAPDRWLFSDGDKLEMELAAAAKGEAGALRFGLRHARNADTYETRDYQSGTTDFLLCAKMANSAVFLLYEAVPWNGIAVELSGRYDRYRYFDTTIFNDASLTKNTSGEETTKRSFNPKVSLRWVAGNTTLNGSVGTGFVPPTPDQLYYSDAGPASQFLANPALEPQRSLTADLGVRRKLGGGADAGVTFFHTRWRDKIGVMITDYGIPLKQQFQNIGQAESKGLELELSQKAESGWSAFFNYTYARTQVTENVANPALVGKELPDMPRHKFNLGFGYEGGAGFTAKGLLRFVGSSFADENNTVTDSKGYRWEREPYHVVDLSITKRINAADLTLAVDNLLDKKYMSGFFWRAEGRIVRAEAALRF